MIRLYTFGPSHYCEKARWSLDHSGVAYREIYWAPGPHVLAARRIASGSSVPILHGEGGVIQGSGAILDWLEASGHARWARQAAPADRDRVARLEARADKELGVAVRRLIYATALTNRSGEIARRLFRGVTGWQAPLAKLMWPGTRRIMVRTLRAADADLADARSELERELDDWDREIGPARRFLCGNSLSRADIAVASLLAPLANPREHPVYCGAMPWPSYRQVIDACRARPSVRWAADLYRDFRQTDAGRAPTSSA